MLRNVLSRRDVMRQAILEHDVDHVSDLFREAGDVFTVYGSIA
jgi:hypothetical protein